MIVVRFPGYIDLLIRGKRIEEMLTQELVDLARELAKHPELAKRVDLRRRDLQIKDSPAK